MSIKKSFAWSLALNICIALVGISRSKYLALFFGPDAIGLVSQAFQLQLIGTTFCSLSLTNGIIKASAEAKTDDERSQILSTSLSVQILLSLLLCLLGFISLKSISDFTFGDSAYSSEVLVVLLGIPFMTLANTQLQAVYFYNEGFNQLNKSSIIANLAYILIFFLLSNHFGVYGAVISISMLALIQFSTHAFFIRNIYPLKKIFSLSWDIDIFKKVFSFAFVSLTTYGLTYTSNFFIRRLIIDELGLHANGIFQVPVSLSMYYLPIVLWVLWGRIFPEVAKHREKMAPQFIKFLLFSIWGFVALAFIISTLKEHLVLLLLSRDFMASLPLINSYLLGDFFYLVSLSIGIYIFAFSKLRAFIAGHFIQFGAYLILTYTLLPQYGLEVIPKCFIASGALTLFFTLIYVFRKQKELIDYKILISILAAGTAISLF